MLASCFSHFKAANLLHYVSLHGVLWTTYFQVTVVAVLKQTIFSTASIDSPLMARVFSEVEVGS